MFVVVCAQPAGVHSVLPESGNVLRTTANSMGISGQYVFTAGIHLVHPLYILFGKFSYRDQSCAKLGKFSKSKLEKFGTKNREIS